MAYTKGTSVLKTVKVNDITLESGLNTIVITGRSLLNDMTISHTSEASETMADGSLRSGGEKCLIEFNIGAIASADLTKLKAMDRTLTTFTVDVIRGSVSNVFEIEGILKLKKSITGGKVLTYKVSTEILNQNIDGILTWA
jgi:hypothetical protein